MHALGRGSRWNAHVLAGHPTSGNYFIILVASRERIPDSHHHDIQRQGDDDRLDRQYHYTHRQGEIAYPMANWSISTPVSTSATRWGDGKVPRRWQPALHSAARENSFHDAQQHHAQRQGKRATSKDCIMSFNGWESFDGTQHWASNHGFGHTS